MSGIYIHIPFCASRCVYCDFYSTTIKNKAHAYVDAVLEEYDLRRGFLPAGEPLRTVYVGGGTPSQLPVGELRRLVEVLCEEAKSETETELDLQEVTVEANPEDISEIWAEGIGRLNEELARAAGQKIVRISLGVQSLVDDELRMLNRRHDSLKPGKAVRLLRKAGIANISLDLMYGLPGQTMETWERSIDGIISLNPEHISAYCLSIEEGTRMERLVSDGALTPADDDLCLAMAALLRKKLRAAGYEQYEISNYAKQGFESRHNSSYWDGTPYLGLGPGAHSYDGKRRRTWNEGKLAEYLDDKRIEGSETLTDADIYNERIMLGLRTAKGVDTALFSEFGETRLLKNLLLSYSHYAKIKDKRLVLTEQGLAIADEIIRHLMK